MSNNYWDFTYANSIFWALVDAGATEQGAAGLLGNLYAESNICPFRWQGDFTTDYQFSRDYTDDYMQASDYTSYVFQHDAPLGGEGYSLAQWTTYSRKDSYYQYCKSHHSQKLGDSASSMEFLIDELQNSYPSVWNVLCNPNTSIEYASDYVLDNFEAPLERPYETRRGYSRQAFEDFSGSPPPPPPLDIPYWLLFKFKHLL